MAWDRQIPFDKDGNLLHYAEKNQSYYGAHEWKEVFEFYGTLKVTDYSRGRSAAYFHLKSQDGRRYPMFLTDFMEIIPRIVYGSVTGIWTFAKRGQNFGLILKKAD